MKELLWLCNLLISIVSVCYFHRTVLKFISFFLTKRFPETEVKHKYAVVIAARNEEAVIGNLIDSIKKQDYPKELLDIFVVADNCTDKTAEIVRNAGVHCYERFDNRHCTKGYALQYLFRNIEKDYGIVSFEGYFIFDADNLLKKDFIARMNDAFHSGEQVVTSYRNTKNIDDNPIASSYALHWVRTARLESRGRSFFGLSTRLQGTGYLFASSLVKEGWNFVTLTEDREFSSHLIAEGVRISYQHRAEFYDEQPVSLRISFRQRIRWAKGNLLAFKMFFFKLWKCTFTGKTWQNKLSAFDIQITNFPYCIFMVPIQLLAAALGFALATDDPHWWSLCYKILGILFIGKIGDIPWIAAVVIAEHKRLKRMKRWKHILFCITFPIFTVIGDISMWIALFSKVTWKPIPHKSDIGIDDIK